MEKSTEHINIYDIANEEGHKVLKIISIYGQPEKKRSIYQILITQLNQFIRNEPCQQVVILGDFNIDFSLNNMNKNKQARDLYEDLNSLGYK